MVWVVRALAASDAVHEEIGDIGGDLTDVDGQGTIRSKLVVSAGWIFTRDRDSAMKAQLRGIEGEIGVGRIIMGHWIGRVSWVSWVNWVNRIELNMFV